MEDEEEVERERRRRVRSSSTADPDDDSYSAARKSSSDDAASGTESSCEMSQGLSRFGQGHFLRYDLFMAPMLVSCNHHPPHKKKGQRFCLRSFACPVHNIMN